MPDEKEVETRDLPLKAILVQALCKECGGNMAWNGNIIPGQTPTHPHVCEKCGERMILLKKYPAVEHRLAEPQAGSDEERREEDDRYEEETR